jgi:hypothetical protein
LCVFLFEDYTSAHDFGTNNQNPFMSEFISVCPKCRQRILCDTAYAGSRVACPVCLQEITMPEPPAANENRPAPSAAGAAGNRVPAPGHAAPVHTPPATAAAAKTKRKFPVLAVSVSAVVLVLAAAAGILALPKWHGQPDAQPQAAAQQNGSPASVKATPAAPNNSDCKALWTFDRGIGAGAIDTSGNGNDAILTGPGALWTADAKVGASALKLTGDSYAQSSGPVVNTANSFTAAAWVKFDVIGKDINNGGYQTVLSIDGNAVSGFYLQLAGDVGKLSFTRQDRDATPSMPTRAMAASAAVAGRWYHLAGVYDASKKTIALYVDGQLQEVLPYNSDWQATGSTVIGRGKWEGRNADCMNGTVDDVRIYDVALSPLDIQALAGKKNTTH